MDIVRIYLKDNKLNQYGKKSDPPSVKKASLKSPVSSHLENGSVKLHRQIPASIDSYMVLEKFQFSL